LSFQGCVLTPESCRTLNTGGCFTDQKQQHITTKLQQAIAVPNMQAAYFLYFVLLGGGNLGGAVLSLVAIDRAGRRPVVAVVCAAGAIAIAVGLALVRLGLSMWHQAATGATLAAIGVVAAAHTAGPQNTMLIYVAEIQVCVVGGGGVSWFVVVVVVFVVDRLFFFYYPPPPNPPISHPTCTPPFHTLALTHSPTH
jgi:hypothetical protein